MKLYFTLFSALAVSCSVFASTINRTAPPQGYQPEAHQQGQEQKQSPEEARKQAMINQKMQAMPHVHEEDEEDQPYPHQDNDYYGNPKNKTKNYDSINNVPQSNTSDMVTRY